ncbi:MAG TPA: hypothetical protein DCX06_02145 [Opitutae bacterium]|nr:hypothetical protein [Opitutae bacterium]
MRLHTTLIARALAVSFLAACNSTCAAAEEATGEMIANPYFDNASYEHWTFSGKWRPDGVQQRIVFDITESNVGFPAAVGRSLHLTLDTQQANHSANPSAKLTRLTANRPYISVYNASAIGPSADYTLYFEIDVITQSGTHRAKSQEIQKPWALPEGDLALEFHWLRDRKFLGDLQSTGRGGVPLESIKEIYYKAVMQVTRPTDPGTETVFVTLDNMSLTYLVEIE